MGIGRKEFLKIAGLALIGISVDPLQAVTTDGNDTYINKKIGVIFKKPKNWKFITVKDYGKILNTELSKNEWLDFKRNHLNDNLDKEIMCIISKGNDSLSSMIFFSVTPKIDLSGLEHLGISVEPTGEVCPDLEKYSSFKTIRLYEPEYISNCKMKQSDAIYTREKNNNLINFKMRNLTFEFKNYYLNFQCHQRAESTDETFADFEKMKSDIILL